nr:hypothetical protein [Tanacetum cinerariifolium]
MECLPNEEIFSKLAHMSYEKPPLKLMFYKVFFFAQWKFLIHTLVQCVSAKRTAWNEFSCSMASAIICLATSIKFNFSKYIFYTMVRNVDNPTNFLMYPRFLQVIINNQVDDLTSHATRYTSPAITQKIFANMMRVGKVPQDPTPTPHASPPSPPHEQPTVTSNSSISLLNTLMETCAILSQKVAELKQDKNTQALEILKLNKKVKKFEKKKKSRFSGLERLRKTLIKMKAEKAKLLDEQIAKRLPDEEEKDDLERAQVLQQQYDDKEENIDWNVVDEQVQEKHLDNIRKYQSLKRKPGSIAQARKTMIIYLKNMAGYKMEHFRGMSYDKVRPIFKRDYKKVQTLFKPDKDVEEPQKKRVDEETLL